MISDRDGSEPDTCGAARSVAMGLAVLPPLTAWLVGGPLLVALVFAALAFPSAWLEPRSRCVLVALALVGQCIALTAAFAGHPWQIDSHMMFFAVLAIVATTASIPALVLAVILTAAHHLGVGLLFPSLIYPSSDMIANLLRTLVIPPSCCSKPRSCSGR